MEKRVRGLLNLDSSRKWYEEVFRQRTGSTLLSSSLLPHTAPVSLTRLTSTGNPEPDPVQLDDGTLRKRIRLPLSQVEGYTGVYTDTPLDPSEGALGKLVAKYGVLVEKSTDGITFAALTVDECQLGECCVNISDDRPNATYVATFFEYTGPGLESLPFLKNSADGVLARVSNTWIVHAFDSANGTIPTTTDLVAEGSTRLYFTDERARTVFASQTTDNLTEGPGAHYATRMRTHGPDRASLALPVAASSQPRDKAEFALVSSQSAKRERDEQFSWAQPEQRQEQSMPQISAVTLRNVESFPILAQSQTVRLSETTVQTSIARIRATEEVIPLLSKHTPAATEHREVQGVYRPQRDRADTLLPTAQLIVAKEVDSVPVSRPAPVEPRDRTVLPPVQHRDARVAEEPLRFTPHQAVQNDDAPHTEPRARVMADTRPMSIEPSGAYLLNELSRRSEATYGAAPVVKERTGLELPPPTAPNARQVYTEIERATAVRERVDRRVLLQESTSDALAKDSRDSEGSALSTRLDQLETELGSTVHRDDLTEAVHLAMTSANVQIAFATSSANSQLSEVGAELRALVSSVRTEANESLVAESGRLLGVFEAGIANLADYSKAAIESLALTVAEQQSQQQQQPRDFSFSTRDANCSIVDQAAVNWLLDQEQLITNKTTRIRADLNFESQQRITRVQPQHQHQSDVIPQRQAASASDYAHLIKEFTTQVSNIALQAVENLDTTYLRDETGLLLTHDNLVKRGINTDDIVEGSSLYYTTARVINDVRNLVDLGDLSDSQGLTVSPQNIRLHVISTDDIVEGNNALYYTENRFTASYAIADRARETTTVYLPKTPPIEQDLPRTAYLKASRILEAQLPAQTRTWQPVYEELVPTQGSLTMAQVKIDNVLATLRGLQYQVEHSITWANVARLGLTTGEDVKEGVAPFATETRLAAASRRAHKPVELYVSRVSKVRDSALAEFELGAAKKPPNSKSDTPFTTSAVVKVRDSMEVVPSTAQASTKEAVPAPVLQQPQRREAETSISQSVPRDKVASETPARQALQTPRADAVEVRIARIERRENAELLPELHAIARPADVTVLPTELTRPAPRQDSVTMPSAQHSRHDIDTAALELGVTRTYTNTARLDSLALNFRALGEDVALQLSSTNALALRSSVDANAAVDGLTGLTQRVDSLSGFYRLQTVLREKSELEISQANANIALLETRVNNRFTTLTSNTSSQFSGVQSALGLIDLQLQSHSGRLRSLGLDLGNVAANAATSLYNTEISLNASIQGAVASLGAQNTLYGNLETRVSALSVSTATQISALQTSLGDTRTGLTTLYATQETRYNQQLSTANQVAVSVTDINVLKGQLQAFNLLTQDLSGNLSVLLAVGNALEQSNSQLFGLFGETQLLRQQTTTLRSDLLNAVTRIDAINAVQSAETDVLNIVTQRAAQHASKGLDFPAAVRAQSQRQEPALPVDHAKTLLATRPEPSLLPQSVVRPEHARPELQASSSRGGPVREQQHSIVPSQLITREQPPPRPVFESATWINKANALGDLCIRFSAPVRSASLLARATYAGMADRVVTTPVGATEVVLKRLPAFITYDISVVAVSDSPEAAMSRAVTFTATHDTPLANVGVSSLAAFLDSTFHGTGEVVLSLGNVAGTRSFTLDMPGLVIDSALRLLAKVGPTCGWLNAISPAIRAVSAIPRADGDPCMLTHSSEGLLCVLGPGPPLSGQVLVALSHTAARMTPMPRLVR